MKMDRAELISWAIKGINEEIYELENTIRKGKKYLEEYENGKQPRTSATPEEIKNIIADRKKQVEILSKKCFDLSWERDVELKE
jgi:archaellum component FlaC